MRGGAPSPHRSVRSYGGGVSAQRADEADEERRNGTRRGRDGNREQRRGQFGN